MIVNGLQLQRAIRVQTERRNLAEARFSGSLKKFPDEKKPDPLKLMGEIEDAERRIAALQTAQARYNLAVMVEVDGIKIPLQEAVKLVGGATRIEKKWTEAATEEVDRYTTVREKDSIMSQRQVDTDQAAKLAKAAARRVREIRYAIQKGNVTEIDVPVMVDLEE